MSSDTASRSRALPLKVVLGVYNLSLARIWTGQSNGFCRGLGEPFRCGAFINACRGLHSVLNPKYNRQRSNPQATHNSPTLLLLINGMSTDNFPSKNILYGSLSLFVPPLTPSLDIFAPSKTISVSLTLYLSSYTSSDSDVVFRSMGSLLFYVNSDDLASASSTAFPMQLAVTLTK